MPDSPGSSSKQRRDERFYWWQRKGKPTLVQEWSDIGRREVNRFVEEVAASRGRPGQRILDAAAGSAFYALYFPDADYLTCDLRLREGEYDYSALDVACDVARLPFRDSSFDTVLCTEALLHFLHPDQVLAEFHRVLGAGGWLALTAPFFGYHVLPFEHDYLRFTGHGIRRLLLESGFTVERLTPVGGRFSAAATHLRRLVPLPLLRMMINRLAMRLDRLFPDGGKYALTHLVVATKSPAADRPPAAGPR
ncbi:MAG: methyltransferase domain-containing protein [Candidatus Riflebacteria bacterium]|nr:methyltransferase domain-containing protein [Candidatus Riflebacteria bacterium]